MKPDNILISSDDIAKITDFGSVRPFGAKNEQFTENQVTLYYRAPEIILGASIYGPAIDVWSIGCIFAEMCNGRVLFRGSVSSEVLNAIYNTLGTPNDCKENKWVGVEKLKGYTTPAQPIIRRDVDYIQTDRDGKLLVYNMLRYNPNDRISCKKALSQNYFK